MKYFLISFGLTLEAEAAFTFRMTMSLQKNLVIQTFLRLLHRYLLLDELMIFDFVTDFRARSGGGCLFTPDCQNDLHILGQFFEFLI